MNNEFIDGIWFAVQHIVSSQRYASNRNRDN